MKILATTGLLAALIAAGAQAQEAGSSFVGGVSYTDLDVRGSRGQVMEYDGKLYGRPFGEGSVRTESVKGMIDFDFKDIGSTDESLLLHADYGSWFKGKVYYDRMTHRTNFTDFGLVINGQFTKIPLNLSQTLIPAGKEMLFKRTETGANFVFQHPEDSSRWLSLEYWEVLKKGTMPSGFYTGGILYFKEANLENTTRDFTLGGGSRVGDNGALSLDLVRREFRDGAEVIRFAGGVTAVKPQLPNTDMTAAEMRFRYDPSKRLAVTGAITGRQRHSHFNQYRVNAGVAALNAAYTAADNLSFSARLYSRYTMVDEDKGFRNVVSNNPAANVTQMDLFTNRAELTTTWRPLQRLLVKLGYKAQSEYRRDAPAAIYTSAAGYSDGTYIIPGQHANSVANDVFKQYFTAKVTADLPLGMTLDGDYQRLQANRAAFVNMPVRSDDAGATLSVPLPGRIDLYMMGQYSHMRNDVHLTRYSRTVNAYRAGLDWEAANKVFVGVDGSYETARNFTEGWFGSTGGSANPANSGLIHVGGMYNRQNAGTAGIHGRINLPKGLTLKANGSYTRATVMTPLDYNPRTDPGQFLGDMTPGDVRIARGRVGLEFTPTTNKNLTARASYRMDHWHDKYDIGNSGRASFTEVGLTTKF